MSFQPIREFLLQEGTKGIEEIYVLLYNRLMGYGSCLTNDKDFVHDQIQELFLWLLNHPERRKKIQKPEIYLLQSLKRNILANQRVQVRSGKKARQYQSTQEQEMCSHESMIILDETKDIQEGTLRLAIEKLSTHQKEVLFLRFYECMEYKDIAEIFDVNIQTMRNTIFRALTKLREDQSIKRLIDMTVILALLPF